MLVRLLTIAFFIVFLYRAFGSLLAFFFRRPGVPQSGETRDSKLNIDESQIQDAQYTDL